MVNWKAFAIVVAVFAFTLLASGCSWLQSLAFLGPVAVSSRGDGLQFAVCSAIDAKSVAVSVRHQPGDWRFVWNDERPAVLKAGSVIVGSEEHPIAPNLAEGDEVLLKIDGGASGFTYGSFIVPHGGFAPDAWVRSDGSVTPEACRE